LVDTPERPVENASMKLEEFYHLAAATVWGIILGKVLSIILRNTRQKRGGVQGDDGVK
jgi:hypothetical protein